MAATLSQPAEQVRIQLSTRHADLELPERTGPILVSTNLKRYALSTLVNTLLSDSAAAARSVPLQFIINGHFLRGSLSDFLNEHGVSAETTLDVEYVRAQLPPTYQSSFQHDDWVGSVDVLSNASPAGRSSQDGIQPGHERILSGCYDGILRIWNSSGSVVAASSLALPADLPNPDPQLIYAAKFLSPTHLVSGGLGVPTRIWSFEDNSSPNPNPSAPTSIRPVLDLKGHKAALSPFDSIAVHAPTSRILTASTEGTANLWSLNSPESTTTTQPTPPTKKARRTATSTPAPPTTSPLTTLAAHTRPVTAAIFHPTTPTHAAYTASADRSLRTWDLATARAVTARIPAPHSPLSALAALPARGLVAASAADRLVYLVDPRDDARRTAAGVLRRARAEVVSLAAEPEGRAAGAGDAGFGLVGAGLDGVVCVWDVRNAGAPTYRVAGRGEDVGGKGAGKKLFSVVWDGDVGVVSGGEDGRVQIYKGP